jgi:hypothetical protein
MSTPLNLLELIEEWDSSSDISEGSYYERFASSRKYHRLHDNIKTLYELKWCKDRPFQADPDAMMEKWLANFYLNNEQREAFELIPKIILYSKMEMESLCEIAYRKLLSYAEEVLGHHLDPSLRNSSFIFIPLTDSGNYWCRHLRHKYGLDRGIFKEGLKDIKSAGFERGVFYVFVEDFVGSGSDAIKKLKRLGIDRLIKRNIRPCYMALISTDWGALNIKNKVKINLISGELLGSQYKCFTDESIIYPEPNQRNIAQRIFHMYGQRLSNKDPEISGFPLGFDHCQLTVVLWDNTPDNSLPIIWYPNKNWFPLFRRNRGPQK